MLMIAACEGHVSVVEYFVKFPKIDPTITANVSI